MAAISPITGYGIHPPFSDFGGNAGSSSTTSGVGGVGAYHRRHQNQTAGSQGAGESEFLAANQDSAAPAPTGSTNPITATSPSSSVADQSYPLLTGDGQTTFSAWLASNAYQSQSPASPGQRLDTLV